MIDGREGCWVNWRGSPLAEGKRGESKSCSESGTLSSVHTWPIDRSIGQVDGGCHGARRKRGTMSLALVTRVLGPCNRCRVGVSNQVSRISARRIYNVTPVF